VAQKIFTSDMKNNMFIINKNLQMTPSPETVSEKLISIPKALSTHQNVILPMKKSRVNRMVDKDGYITSLAKYNSYTTRRKNTKKMLDDINHIYKSNNPNLIQKSVNEVHFEKIANPLGRYTSVCRKSSNYMQIKRQYTAVNTSTSKTMLNKDDKAAIKNTAKSKHSYSNYTIVEEGKKLFN
jgi:hypothetical protein